MPGKRSQQNLRARTGSETGLSRSGRLYVVAVPIGDLDDLTVRAIRTLKTVDIIASEDPQVTQRLLSHHQIEGRVISYGPYHVKEKIEVLLQRLRQGTDVALVSDCGSPLIADPGHLLVAAAHAHHIPVVPIPGPSAVIAALSTTGLPCDAFFFFGHLPNNPARILRCLTVALERDVPTMVFCTATSVVCALRALIRLAPRRRIVLACDLTRTTERIISGTARRISQDLSGLQGQDMTLIVAGQKGR
ncbi:MAG: rRNA small subunit methyltransferase 1 [Nitrospira sp.]|nr:rRNA small subunit methyltransferase 1 [Nitrospira sp.]